jgi:uncharacterized protein YbjT (DUF2867 family)
MRILLTGANGFIGRYLLGRLSAAGHAVVPAVRRPAETDRLLPAPASIAVDLNRDTAAAAWRPRLAGIDAVINCAGILQGRPGQSIAAIHDAAPRALFEACRAVGLRRVIQISAISAEPAAGTAYALTKHAADTALAASDLDWVILRPSLVYAEGAYGGTALFRALAAMPFAIPVVGDGRQLFRPIHVDDLAAAVLAILERPAIRRQVIDPVGPDALELGTLLADLRRWLGLPAAPLLHVPVPLVRLAARLGDLAGGPLSTTAMRQLAFGNSGALEPFVAATGVQPRRWRDALLARPAQPQDRWHARLTLLRPLLRLALAALWLGSGLIGLLQPAAATAAILAGLDLGPAAARGLATLACAADLAIGVALLARWRPGLLAQLQLLLVAGYSLALTVAVPALWADPFGPLLKNLPILAAIAVLAVLERER